jgi:hypothetical protein
MPVGDNKRERMAAAITAGESAADSGLVSTPEEQEEWDTLAASIASVKDAGYIVQIPNEWPGEKYDVMYDGLMKRYAEEEAAKREERAAKATAGYIRLMRAGTPATEAMAKYLTRRIAEGKVSDEDAAFVQEALRAQSG